MKIKEITTKVSEFAPVELAEAWDNVGLMMGDVDNDCQGVLVALDLTVSVVQEAIDYGCNLIITHHPFFFAPVKSIDLSQSRGKIIEMCIKNDITVYAAHTNLDECEGGLCQSLASYIGGTNLVSDGVGVVCDGEECTLDEFAMHIASTLNDNSVKVVGDGDTIIRKVFCICGGGASDSAYAHAKEVADCFVTGDMKHHLYVASENDNFPIIEFSHYHSEIMVMNLLEDIVADTGVKIIKANQNGPFRVVGGIYEY